MGSKLIVSRQNQLWRQRTVAELEVLIVELEQQAGVGSDERCWLRLDQHVVDRIRFDVHRLLGHRRTQRATMRRMWHIPPMHVDHRA